METRHGARTRLVAAGPREHMPTGMAALLAMAFVILGVPHSARAAWLDPAWSYRRAITVSNSGQALADYQIKASLDASFEFSRTKADASDLRATDGDGVTNLPFWIEEWNPAAQKATVWVRVPSLPAGDTKIYLYYGNPVATSASSGDATFDLFDDFSGTLAPPDVYGNWPRVVVDPYLDGAHNVTIEQVDADGKADIVADGYRAGVLNWYEQPADPVNGTWTKHIIDSDLGNAHDHQIGDIDGDGRRDIVALSLSATWADYSAGEGYVAWYQKPADPHAATSSGWTPRQPLPSPLADPGAAVFDNKLYVFGGHHFGGVDPQDLCYRYDPATDTWTQLASLPSPRWGQVAVEFEGRIHVFAGNNGSGGIADHLIYDPVGDTWSAAPSPVPAGIADHGLMAIRLGSVIHLFRGEYHYTYDPVADTYEPMAGPPTPRVWGTCALVDGRIYLIGGGPSGAGSANEAYDPSSDTWTSRSPMPVDRWGATRENPVVNGIIYVTHGMISSFYATDYAYDPSTDTWAQKSSGMNPRDGVGCGVINNKLYVAGGRDDDLLGGTGRQFVEEYDPVADTGPTGWRKIIIAHSGDYGLLGSRSAGLGDVDGDGDPDIAVAVDGYERHATGQLFWYENPGGTDALDPAKWHEYLIDNTQGNGADAQIGDIDGDGHKDIVYSAHAGAPQMTFIYFAPADPRNVSGWQRMTVAGGSYHVHLVDFDGDGDLDVLKASIAEGRVTWLENPGGAAARDPAQWHEYTIDSGGPIPRFNRVTTADIDGDGDLDVGVETNTGTGGAYKWYRRPADPRNVAAYQIYTIDDNSFYTAYAHDADVGDINGDGRPDFAGVGAGAGYGPEYDGNKVMWYPNLTTSPTSMLDPAKWQSGGSPSLAGGVLTISGAEQYVRSTSSFQNRAFRTRARFASYADFGYIGFNYGSMFVGDYDAMFVGFGSGNVQSITSSAHNVFTWGYSQSEGVDWKVWEVGCAPSQASFFVDGALRRTHTTTVPTVPLMAQINSHTGSPRIEADWALVRSYAAAEPGSAIGVEESYAGPQAPHITSTPILTGKVGAPYAYDVNADGDPLPQYALLAWPPGMTINGTSGLIQWTPGMDQADGPYQVTVQATNSQGADTQTFGITVAGIAPLITSTPITAGSAGHPYTYDVGASGAPPPTFALTVAPAGMTIDAVSGVIGWTPDLTQVGRNPVTVRATNSAGSVSQSFAVEVADAFDPQAWNYRMRIAVDNTGNSGGMTDYPVRIDLDAGRLDFSHARTQGEDVRFTTSDGATVLSHWKERWDASGQSALLWVKIPAIPAHDSTVVYMYYGNPASPDRSNGEATFELFDGFDALTNDVYGSWPRVVVDSYLDGAHNVHIEQVDGDGRPDLVADAYRAGILAWYQQPSDPVNMPWTKRVIDPDLPNAHDCNLADINGDGRRDIVALSLSAGWQNYSGGEGYVAWYQKPEDPTQPWTKTVIAHSGDYGLLGARSMGLGDIDGDGIVDIAVAVDGYERHTTGQLFWFHNPGGQDASDPGKWRQYLIDNTQGNGADAQIGDIDGDGHPDIVYSAHMGTTDNQKTFVYFAPPDPTNVAGWQRMTVAGGSYHTCLVDFDGDGDLDILEASIALAHVSWLENPGGATARDPASWHEYVIDSGGSASRFNRVTAVDIDGDGRLDVGVEANAGESGGAYKWYRRPVDPKNVSAYQIYTVDNVSLYTAYAHDADVADIDGDGRPDFAGVAAGANFGPQYDGNRLCWYPNQKVTVPGANPAKWNSSSTMTVADGAITVTGSSQFIRSTSQFQYRALRSRARFASYANWGDIGFNSCCVSVGGNDAMFVGMAGGIVQPITSAGGSWTWGTATAEGTDWKVWDVLWNPNQTKFQVNDALRTVNTTKIPSVPLSAQFNTNGGSPAVVVDWALVRPYLPPEPVALTRGEGPSCGGDSYVITASAGPGGAISPNGGVAVSCGASQMFDIVPAAGFTIAGVLVDGSSAGPVASYTFTNVRSDHTIAATFAALDMVAASVPEGACVSAAHACVAVPVDFTRIDTTPMRAYSVNLRLGAGLVACGAHVAPGTYLSQASMTNFEVIDRGGGAYEVDEAILGAPCGATGSGTLFTVYVGSTAASGTGTITIDSVRIRDCANSAVPGQPGPAASVLIDNTPPPAVTALAAQPVTSGNDATGTTKILVTFTPPTDGSRVEIYRKGFGNYPEYDDGVSPGSEPVAPASYPPPGWDLVGVTASGQMDHPATRDAWYYLAYSIDGCGNATASGMTAGTLDYFLGDVHDGATNCAGDNRVTLADISYFGAHYGASLTEPDTLACLDIGPTTNGWVTGCPRTDDRVDFEDLMLFAINYGHASLATLRSRPAPEVNADASALTVITGDMPSVGETFDAVIRFMGRGDVQGVSAKLVYDAQVVEPVGVVKGALLEQQSGPAEVFSPEPGVVDAAVFGHGLGIAGTGELARVRFRVKAAGEAGIALAGVKARNSANQPVRLGDLPAGAGRPQALLPTGLGPVYPNPFSTGLGVQLSLAHAGPVKLVVYDMAGRRVKGLLDGEQPAGTQLVRWDARDEGGRPLAPGYYVLRLEAGGISATRRVQLIR